MSATLAIYLDLFNIFQNLLFLLGIFGGSSPRLTLADTEQLRAVQP